MSILNIIYIKTNLKKAISFVCWVLSKFRKYNAITKIAHAAAPNSRTRGYTQSSRPNPLTNPQSQIHCNFRCNWRLDGTHALVTEDSKSMVSRVASFLFGCCCYTIMQECERRGWKRSILNGQGIFVISRKSWE